MEKRIWSLEELDEERRFGIDGSLAFCFLAHQIPSPPVFADVTNLLYRI
jgi:hypothetical protein